MAKVTWAPGISTVSGALAKINKKSPHAADQQMLLATHRTAPTTSPDCSRLYMRGLQSVTRSTPVTADELAQRLRFKAVAAAVAARGKNLTTLAQDRQAFNNQKELANGKKTFKSYLWMLELESYDASH